nr:hypothetical protein CcurKRNrm1_p136 [Cryptomonas curvata]
MYFRSPIIKITILLLNELNSPELLPYSYEIIWFYRELINYQKILILIGLFHFKKENISSVIKKMEIDRIDYLLKTYHRVRIWKIEANLIGSNCKINNCTRLSSDEKIYLKRYILLNKKFIKATILDFTNIKMTKIFRNNLLCFDKKSNSVKQSYVFFKILKKKQFLEENIFNKTCLFYKNEIYSIEYEKVKKLVYSTIIVLL